MKITYKNTYKNTYIKKNEISLWYSLKYENTRSYAEEARTKRGRKADLVEQQAFPLPTYLPTYVYIYTHI